MNTPNDELELRRRLRQLPPDRAPRRDLWQGIETRLVPPHHARRAPRSWLRPLLALAAVLALALALAWHPAFLRTEPSLVHQPAPGRAGPSLRREADPIALEERVAIVRATPAVPRTKPRSNPPYPMSMRKGRRSDCESASASL